MIDSKLAPQPDERGGSKYTTTTQGSDSKFTTTTEGGDSKFTTTTHDSKRPPGVTHSGPLNEIPPDGYLLAEEPCAGGAPPDGACSTEDGDTLHKVAS